MPDKEAERTIDRDASVREMIELAISLFLGNESWPAAITLARAAQQYLHEKLRSNGMESVLAKQHAFLRDEMQIEIRFQDYRDHQTGYANLLKHSRDPDEPPTVTVKANRVSRGIELAIADYKLMFGSTTPAMNAFAMSRLVSNAGAGSRDNSAELNAELEELRLIALSKKRESKTAASRSHHEGR